MTHSPPATGRSVGDAVAARDLDDAVDRASARGQAIPQPGSFSPFPKTPRPRSQRQEGRRTGKGPRRIRRPQPQRRAANREQAAAVPLTQRSPSPRHSRRTRGKGATHRKTRRRECARCPGEPARERPRQPARTTRAAHIAVTSAKDAASAVVILAADRTVPEALRRRDVRLGHLSEGSGEDAGSGNRGTHRDTAEAPHVAVAQAAGDYPDEAAFPLVRADSSGSLDGKTRGVRTPPAAEARRQPRAGATKRRPAWRLGHYVLPLSSMI